MEELDLKELLQLFWEKRVQILIIIAIFIVLGVIYSVGFVEPKYEANTSLLLATNSLSDSNATGSITTTDVTLNQKLVTTYTDLVQSDRVIRNVISNLALDVPEESIKNNVSVTAETDSSMMKITVRNDSPVEAQKIANELTKVFIEAVKEYYKIDNLYIVDEAEVPSAPYNINHVKDVVIFAAIGIVVAIMYVLIANMLDTTIKSAQDIEKITKLTVLASIPLYGADDKNKANKKKGGKKKKKKN